MNPEPNGEANDQKKYFDKEAAKKLEDERRYAAALHRENARREFVRKCAMRLYVAGVGLENAISRAEQLAAELGKRGHFNLAGED